MGEMCRISYPPPLKPITWHKMTEMTQYDTALR